MRRTTQKHNLLAAFAALHIHPTVCLVVFVAHTTVYGNDVGLFSDYFHIILFREVLEEKAQLLETISSAIKVWLCSS